MRVDGEHQLVDGAFQFDDSDGFSDEFGGLRPDDVDAEEFAVFGVGDYFDEAIVAVDDACLGVAGKGKFTHLDLEAFFFGLRFGEARAADLRIRVGAGRDPVAADRTEGAAGYVADGDDPAHGADVRELWEAGNDVADSVDAGLGGLLGFVHLDESAIEFDLGFL